MLSPLLHHFLLNLILVFKPRGEASAHLRNDKYHYSNPKLKSCRNLSNNGFLAIIA